MVEHHVMTPFGDGAKFVVAPGPLGHGFALIFVDGHGYSRCVAHSAVTDVYGNDLAWIAETAAQHHGVAFERESS